MLSLPALSTLLMRNIFLLTEYCTACGKNKWTIYLMVDVSTYTAGNSLSVSETTVYKTSPIEYGKELAINNCAKVLHVADRLICRTISGSNLSRDLFSKTSKHVGMC